MDAAATVVLEEGAAIALLAAQEAEAHPALLGLLDVAVLDLRDLVGEGQRRELLDVLVGERAEDVVLAALAGALAREARPRGGADLERRRPGERRAQPRDRRVARALDEVQEVEPPQHVLLVLGRRDLAGGALAVEPRDQRRPERPEVVAALEEIVEDARPLEAHAVAQPRGGHKRPSARHHATKRSSPTASGTFGA
jgi:hypothetical protein